MTAGRAIQATGRLSFALSQTRLQKPFMAYTSFWLRPGPLCQQKELPRRGSVPPCLRLCSPAPFLTVLLPFHLLCKTPQNGCRKAIRPRATAFKILLPPAFHDLSEPECSRHKAAKELFLMSFDPETCRLLSPAARVLEKAPKRRPPILLGRPPFLCQAVWARAFFRRLTGVLFPTASLFHMRR